MFLCVALTRQRHQESIYGHSLSYRTTGQLYVVSTLRQPVLMAISLNICQFGCRLEIITGNGSHKLPSLVGKRQKIIRETCMADFGLVNEQITDAFDTFFSVGQIFKYSALSPN